VADISVASLLLYAVMVTDGFLLAGRDNIIAWMDRWAGGGVRYTRRAQRQHPSVRSDDFALAPPW
jgi:hypothetical protein